MVVGLWRVLYKVIHLPGYGKIHTSVGDYPSNINYELEEVRRELIDVFWMDETNEMEVRMELSCMASEISDIPFQSLKNEYAYAVYTPLEGNLYFANNDYVYKAEIYEIKDDKERKEGGTDRDSQECVGQ